MGRQQLPKVIVKGNAILLVAIFFAVCFVIFFFFDAIFYAPIQNVFRVVSCALLTISVLVLFVFIIIFLSNNLWQMAKRQQRLLSYFILLSFSGFAIRYFLIGVSGDRWILATYLVDHARMAMHTIWYEVDIRMIAWPLIQKTAFLFMHSTMQDFFILNVIIGSLTPIIFFYLALYTVRDEKVASICSILICFSPLFIHLSTTESYEIPALAFAALSIVLLLKYIRKGDGISLAMSLIALFVAVQIKPEYILFLIVYSVAATLYGCNIKIGAYFGLLMLLLMPYLTCLLCYYDHSPDIPFIHGITIDKNRKITSYVESLEFSFRQNTKNGLIGLFSPQSGIPSVISMFAVIGLGFSLFLDKRLFWLNFTFFCTFLLAYSCFVFSGISIHGRYLAVLTPVILAASFGISSIAGILGPRNAVGNAFIVIALVFLIFTGAKISSQFADRRWNDDPRHAEYVFLKAHLENISPTCKFVMNGRGLILPSLVNSKETATIVSSTAELENILRKLRKDRCYYFYQGFYDIMEDRAEPITRIYDEGLVIDWLGKSGFEPLFNKEISNIHIFLYQRNPLKA